MKSLLIECRNPDIFIWMPTWKKMIHVVDRVQRLLFVAEAHQDGSSTNWLGIFERRIHGFKLSRPSIELSRISVQSEVLMPNKVQDHCASTGRSCKFRCGICNSPLTGGWSTGKQRKYAYYRSRTSGCDLSNLRRHELKARFYTERLTPSPNVVAEFIETVRDEWKRRRGDAEPALQAMQRRLATARQRKLA